MKSGDVEGTDFDVLSDDGRPIGLASVLDRKMVNVQLISTSTDTDPWAEHMPKIMEWAEAEARRLGLLDD